MNPDPKKYGRTEVVPTHMLQPAAFDFFDGQPPPPGLGKTEAPVNVLPAWEIDMGEPVPTPALVLTLRLRPDATPAAVAVDVLLLHKALNEYELSLGGSGLVPDERRSGPADGGGVVRLMLTSADAAGASDRLAKLAAAINGEQAILGGGFAGRSIVAWSAELAV